MNLTLVIDADVLVYRFGFGHEKKPFKELCWYTKDWLHELFLKFDTNTAEGFITSEDKSNYRYSLAVTQPYKGQRPGIKPIHYTDYRVWLEELGVEKVYGQEADDAVGIRATELGNNAVMVHVDKDIDCVPGRHYNFVQHRYYVVSPEEATRNFYRQILTGDTIDNIKGLKGIGPVKAEKILGEATKATEYYKRVVEAYEGNEDRVLENARLLWIRHQPDELWEPPKDAGN